MFRLILLLLLSSPVKFLRLPRSVSICRCLSSYCRALPCRCCLSATLPLCLFASRPSPGFWRLWDSSWLKARPTSLATTVRGVSLTQRSPAGKLSRGLVCLVCLVCLLPSVPRTMSDIQNIHFSLNKLELGRGTCWNSAFCGNWPWKHCYWVVSNYHNRK